MDPHYTLSDIPMRIDMLCVFTEEESLHFVVGEVYTFIFDQYGSEVYRKTSGTEVDSISWNKEVVSRCTWNNPNTWVEFVPARWISDEDMFAIKMAGAESIFGNRTPKADKEPPRLTK